jgi:hypothetical protein
MRTLATTVCALCLTGAFLGGTTAPAAAGVLPTNIAALKTADTSLVTEVRWGWRGGGWGWRGGGWGHRGWGWGGAAVAAGVLGGALVASSYYSPYAYGYPAYGYGYGYGYPAYGYPAYGYGYGYAPYYGGYGYGYARPYYRPYYASYPYRRAYWRGYW